MGKLPITSSLKRTAFQLRSVAKQTKKGKLGEVATGGGSGEGSTKTIEEDVMGEDTNYVHKGKKGMTDATRKGICDGSIKGNKSKVNCGDVVVDKKETVVKEDGVDFDVDYQKSNQGRFLTYDQQRDSDLNVKRAGRNTRVSGNRLDKTNRKLAKLAEKGITSGRRFDRLTRRQKENTEELAAFESGQANTKLAVDSGGAQGERYQKADTDVTVGEQSQEKQLAEKKRLAEKAARDEAKQNVAESEGVTTGQSGGAVGTGGGQATNAVDPGSSAGGMFDVGAFAPTDYSKILQGNSVAQKRGYGMKAKSVATKKLQGAQGKLPSHLQAAIKAAPGKKSVLKKSYFKNK
jgi:hypothetical protein|tara:strand:+ start:803 stop:1846 length:1044 start_codon:yes stop_codon:yes gene_type:complete